MFIDWCRLSIIGQNLGSLAQHLIMEVKFDAKNPPHYEHIRPFRFVRPYDH
jgi:hypothetical protein